MVNEKFAATMAAKEGIALYEHLRKCATEEESFVEFYKNYIKGKLNLGFEVCDICEISKRRVPENLECIYEDTFDPDEWEDMAHVMEFLSAGRTYSGVFKFELGAGNTYWEFSNYSVKGLIEKEEK